MKKIGNSSLMKKRKLKNKRKGENVIEVFLKVVKANRKSTKEHL